MRHHGQLPRTRRDGPHRVEAGEAGTEQDAGQPERRHPVEPRLQGVDRAGDVGQVQGPTVRGRVRRRDRLRDHRHPLPERRRGLIGQPVVVLHDVHPAAGEGGRDSGELRRRQTHRLDRGGEQGPPCDARQRPDPVDPEARPGKRAEDLRRQRQIHHARAAHERDVAVDHVQELGELGAGRLDRIRDAGVVARRRLPVPPGARTRDVPPSSGRAFDGLHPTQHPRLDALATHSRRHFDRLLPGNRAGEVGGGAAVGHER